MLKIAIYTSVYGQYDKINDPSFISENVDYYAFTDRPIKSRVWRNILVPSDLDPTRAARKIKILGHEVLEKYEYVIWVDGNIDIQADVTELLNQHTSSELLAFKHPSRQCIYEEARACIAFEKDDPKVINRHVEFLRSKNYPINNGLIESGVLLKRNSPTVKATMEIWWELVSKFSKRDQLSFNYAAYEANLNFTLMGESNARGNSKYFRIRKDHENFGSKLKFKIKKIMALLPKPSKSISP